MANNIYTTAAWVTGTVYKQNDIVLYQTRYYYALTDHISAAAFETDLLLWGGVATDNNSEIKPVFIWIPSYSSPLNSNPKIKKTQFGDGYAQRIKDGINNNLLELDLTFEERYLQESSAIAHFLMIRAGTESFLFTPPPPYARRTRFVCESWNFIPNFYNNNSVRAKFIEVVN